MTDMTPIKAVEQAQSRFNVIAGKTKALQWAEECQFATQAIEKNSMLAECAPHTIQNAVINVASVGLSLNPADGYAYLVPEYNKDTRQKECQLRVSFKGLLKAATDSGCIHYVRAEVVYENDTFTLPAPDEKPEHSFNPFSKDRGAPIGVYCYAKLTTGEFLTDVMEWDEVSKIRECAKTKYVWDKWPMEMAKKAIIKRAAKRWPQSGEGAHALNETIHVINDAEGSDFTPYTAEQKDQFDKLVESENAVGFALFLEFLKTKDPEQQIYTALFNSGAKGKKTALKDSVRQLESLGYDAITQIREQIADGEQDAFKESVDELTKWEKGALFSCVLDEQEKEAVMDWKEQSE